MNVVCYGRDWRLKGLLNFLVSFARVNLSLSDMVYTRKNMPYQSGNILVLQKIDVPTSSNSSPDLNKCIKYLLRFNDYYF